MRNVSNFRARTIALALTIPLAACGGSAEVEGPGPSENPLRDAAATITSEDMIHRIGVLAHDSMEGRDTPSRGLEKAARYIVDEFRALGLEGGAGNGEFIQRFPYPLIGVDTARAGFTLTGGSNAPALRYGTDFLVLAGASESVDASLVYAGGLQSFTSSTPAAGSLNGRVPVVMLGDAFDQAAQRAMAAAGQAAANAGAGAIVYVLGPGFPEATWSQLRRYMGQPRRVLGGVTGITSVVMTQTAAASLFRAGGIEVASLAPAPTTPSAIGSLRVALRAPLTRQDDTAPNVIAVLRGSDPELADEYVVFSAHMDHDGIGSPDASGDSIYNGADDDASGTAALIEVAEAFTNLLQRPRRSLVFMAVSGEEKGLLGSRWYSDHPTLPLEQTVANINVDMIGRNAPDTIVVIGQEYSSLGPLVHEVARDHQASLDLNVALDPWPEERFFFRSDHFNFARKEIPALFFFAGTHEDYHEPSDEVEKIDGDKAMRVARLVFFTSHRIADTVARPQWTEQGLAEIRALTGGGR